VALSQVAPVPAQAGESDALCPRRGPGGDKAHPGPGARWVFVSLAASSLFWAVWGEELYAWERKGIFFPLAGL